MQSATVRISELSRKALRDLSEKTGEPMQAILDKAIELYRRQRFLEEVNTAYAAVRQDEKAWSEIEKERGEWDATLLDGLQEVEKPSKIAKVSRKKGVPRG